MTTHDVKTNIKKHFGFNTFHTTPINPKNTQNIALLSSIKPSICMRGYSQAYFPTNYAKNPYFTTICYNIAITYFKRSLVKCI